MKFKSLIAMDYGYAWDNLSSNKHKFTLNSTECDITLKFSKPGP